MKSNIIFLLAFLTIGFISCNDKTSNSNSTSTQTYVAPTPSCKPSTSKVRRLVDANWSSIRSTADFTVSAKGSFEIRDYGMDGDDLVVDIYSKGYMWDISFTASFDAYFDDDCNLRGSVTDCYNYRKH